MKGYLSRRSDSMTGNKPKPDTVTAIEQFSYLDQYKGKKCLITLVDGRPLLAYIRGISAYELLIEEGTRNGTPIQKLLFKHAIALIEERA